MIINMNKKKMLVAGIQDSGKTYLVKRLIRPFKTLVYTPHVAGGKDKWINEPNNVTVFKVDDIVEDFPIFCEFAKKLAMKRKINMMVINEADILFESYWHLPSAFKDIIANHIHYGGLSIIMETRAPNDIPLRAYRTCEYLAIFTLDEPNVIRKLNGYYPNFGDMVKNIPYGSHIFAFKEIGQEPRLMKV